MVNVIALERGLKILDLLIEIESDAVRRQEGVSVQQVAGELDVHKSTASRLMQTLVSRGYAVPVRDSRRGFRLGPAAQIHLGLTFDQRRLSELAHPFLARLVDETGECAHAAVTSGAWALVIDDVETGQPLRVVAGKGRRVPLHCTSAGKALLAFGAASVPHELAPRTGRTITNPAILNLQLAEIRERGYALDDEENHPGVRCISAPVFDRDGNAIGCIGIDGPMVRMVDAELERLVGHVVGAARSLSETLSESAAIPAIPAIPAAG